MSYRRPKAMSRRPSKGKASSKRREAPAKEAPLGLITHGRVELVGNGVVLGTGTYGEVRRYETSQGHLVAVKSARDVADGVSPSLLREAAAMSVLAHPNVARLLDAYVSPTEMALVLPLASSTLSDEIKQDALDDEAMKAVAIQLIRALAYVHSKDVVHADVKPGNVLMYSRPGCPVHAVLADFGGARTSRCFDLERPNQEAACSSCRPSIR